MVAGPFIWSVSFPSLEAVCRCSFPIHFWHPDIVGFAAFGQRLAAACSRSRRACTSLPVLDALRRMKTGHVGFRSSANSSCPARMIANALAIHIAGLVEFPETRTHFRRSKREPQPMAREAWIPPGPSLQGGRQRGPNRFTGRSDSGERRPPWLGCAQA